MKRLGLVVLAVVALASPARAHVGSPDVFYEGAAGPYRVLVTVRPPDAVPGIAEVSARVAEPVEAGARMTMVPLPAQGIGARLSPVPDVAKRDRDDTQTFVGHLWLMQAGPWQVRLHLDGARGAGELAVPVPALPARSKTMSAALGLGLLALLLLLALGAVSIAGAGARDAALDRGREPTSADRWRGVRARVVAGVLVALALVGGRLWWNAEASDYARYVYTPLALDAHVDGAGTLALQRTDPGWLRWRRVDDLVPDHGHLMHLYVVREPEMDRVWHLHPEATGAGAFRFALPAMPAGRYRLCGDVVHQSGLAETAVAELELPAIAGTALDGDDAAGPTPAHMVWLRDEAQPLRARQPTWFRFQLQDAAGAPEPLEPYMGMLGHAAFIRRDGSVFAHVHPSGSVPMAALTTLDGGEAATGAARVAADQRPPNAHPHAGHVMAQSGATEVAFPYGFPRAGDYRIFVQVKRAGRIETGVFDAHVD